MGDESRHAAFQEWEKEPFAFRPERVRRRCDQEGLAGPQTTHVRRHLKAELTVTSDAIHLKQPASLFPPRGPRPSPWPSRDDGGGGCTHVGRPAGREREAPVRGAGHLRGGVRAAVSIYLPCVG